MMWSPARLAVGTNPVSNVIPSSIYPLEARTCLCQSVPRKWRLLKKDKKRLYGHPNDQQESRFSSMGLPLAASHQSSLHFRRSDGRNRSVVCLPKADSMAAARYCDRKTRSRLRASGKCNPNLRNISRSVKYGGAAFANSPLLG